jgi:hypothetical protein
MTCEEELRIEKIELYQRNAELRSHIWLGIAEAENVCSDQVKPIRDQGDKTALLLRTIEGNSSQKRSA